MRVCSPDVVVLTSEEHQVLTGRARSRRTEYRDRLRAQIVLAAAAGQANAAIARALGVGVDLVRRWRHRFATERFKGLQDRARSGRPLVHGPAVRAQAVALACELPAQAGVPLSRWTIPELARDIAARCAAAVSVSTMRR